MYKMRRLLRNANLLMRCECKNIIPEGISFFRLLWVWIRTFGPRELGLWVLPESYRTRTLESQFETSSSSEKLRPQSLKWTGFLMGESPDHVFWVMSVLHTVVNRKAEKNIWCHGYGVLLMTWFRIFTVLIDFTNRLVYLCCHALSTKP